MGRKKESRDTVISIRLDDTSMQAIDLLVHSGLAQSRSEGAAQLVILGIRAADDLLEQASTLAESVQRIKNDMIDAVKAKNVDRVQQLLSNDASLANAQNEHGETAVMLSAYYHAKEIRNVLLAKGPTLDFYEACAVGDLTRVQELHDLEPQLINRHNADGYTPLGLAAFFGHFDVARFLISKGADIHLFSKDGQFNNTALHAAIAGNYSDIVKLLIDHGANVNSRATGSIRAGFTPLHVAAGGGKKDLISLLVAHGADKEAKNDNGLTPAEYAHDRGFEEIYEWLKTN